MTMTATSTFDRFSDRPSPMAALRRGLRRKCPNCGNHDAFSGYLTLTPACTGCGAPLGDIRADDAPPYFTITVVGKIVIGLVLMAEKLWQPSTLVHTMVWPALTIALTLALLPLIKGGVVGVMWAVGLRGDEHH
ncbi:MAG: DUF983 domain-containing protein [Sphingomonadales bacterium]